MDDVTAAAVERMRTKWTATSKTLDERGEHRIEYLTDLAVITDAYLSEHPSDDAQPVTEEWLMKVGFRVREDGVMTYTHLVNEPVRIVWSVDLWQGRLCDWWNCAVQRMAQDCDRIAWPHAQTRGDVRQLFRALRFLAASTAKAE